MAKVNLDDMILLRKRDVGMGKVAAWIRKDAIAWIMIAPCLLCYMVFVWGPLIEGVVMSFFETKGFDMVKFTGFQNYIEVMTDSLFLKAVGNTVKYTFWSVIIGFPLPIIAAIAVNEVFRGKGFFRFALYFPTIIPGIAAMIMWGILYEPGAGGMLNLLLSKVGLPAQQWLQNPNMTIPLIVVTMSWSGFGGTMILYMADLQSVNNDLYEAASLDGAGIIRKCWHVTLPHMSGLMKMLFIMQIISVFQIFQQPLTMTGGGPNNASVSLGLVTYNYAFSYMQVGRSVALSVLTGLMLAVFSIIYFKLQRNKDSEAEYEKRKTNKNGYYQFYRL